MMDETWLVDDVMRRWPAAIRVFLDHRMRCVGCPIGCFHTVSDACREHDVDPSGFMTVLLEAVESAEAGTASTAEKIG